MRIELRSVIQIVLCLTLAAPGCAASAVADWDRFEKLREESRLEQALDLLDSWTGKLVTKEDRLRFARSRFQIRLAQNRYDDAQAAGQRGIRLAEELQSDEDWVKAQYSIGRVFSIRRRNKQALQHYQQARLKARKSDPKSRFQITLALATTESAMANYAEADTYLREAEGLWLECDQDSELGASLWQQRAIWHLDRGDALGSLPYYEKALRLATESGSSSTLLAAWTNLGQAHVRLNNWAKALDALEKASGLQPHPSQLIIILGTMGICQFELNQFGQATTSFEEVRRIAREMESSGLEGWAIGELGLIYGEVDADHDRAIQHFDIAIELFGEAGDARNQLVFVENKAHALRDQQKCREALLLYDEVYRRTLRLGQKVTAALLKGKGQCFAGLGDVEAAESQLRASLEAATSAGDSKRIWQSHWELAKLYSAGNQADKADRAFVAALDQIDDTRQSLRLGSFKADFFKDKVQVYRQYADFLVYTRRDPIGAFAVAERARARSFLDSLAEVRAEVQETLPEGVLARERSLLSQISSLQASIRRAEGSAELERQLKKSEHELDAFYLQLHSQYPEFYALRYPQPTDLRVIQGKLAEDEAVFEYLVGDTRTHLWIIKQDAFEHRELPGRANLESTVRKAYSQLVTPSQTTDLLPSLSKLLLGEETIRQGLPRSLIIVPSEILFYFPFEVLPSGEGNEPLAASTATTYLPSASTLTYLGGGRRSMEASLLAVGDPIYSALAQGNARERSVSLSGLRNLGALPHTRSEVFAIRKFFGAEQSTVLIGELATESLFKKQDLSSYNVIHLATHGWIDAKLPSRSGLVLGLENEETEDGILQAREIFRLALEAELVTLSACQSALGALITGEGMVGLTRAFLFAGARSIVASLWNVNDEATAYFMSGFYEFLQEGHTKSEALRRARVRMREHPNYRHPYFWAPYVLIGDGKSALRFPERHSLTSYTTFSLLLFAGIVFLYFSLRWRSKRG